MRRVNLTGLGETEAIHALRKVVHADVLRFAAVLEEFLCRKTVRITKTTHTRYWVCGQVTDY